MTNTRMQAGTPALLRIMYPVVLVACVILLGACQALERGPSDEELIMGQVQAMKDSLFAGDVDGVLAVFSENFSHYEVPDKETLAGHLKMGKEMGYLDELETHDAEISLEDAEVTIEDNSATVYPIDATSDMGYVTLELVFKKEDDGVWRIVSGDVEGI